MFGLGLAFAARLYYFTRRCAQTNVQLDAIQTRRGLKWGVPVMMLALPYGLVAAYFSTPLEAGGVGWLNLLALLSVWNMLKLHVTGPVTLVQLRRVRRREGRTTQFHASKSEQFSARGR